MKYEELAQSSIVHTIVYGDTGSGKTTLTCSLLEKFKLIYVSTDNGAKRIFDKLPPAWRANLDIIVMPDTKDFAIAFTSIRKLLKGSQQDVCHAHGRVGCGNCMASKAAFSRYEFNKLGPNDIVVLDHLTSITDSAMNTICENKSVEYKPKLDDWGTLRFWMMELMKDIEKAQFNIVAIAQTMDSKTEGGEQKLFPNVGSYEFGRLVGQHFDNVVICELVMGAHKFGSMTSYSPRYITRSRDDIAIEKMAKPSLVPFYKFHSEQELEKLGKEKEAEASAPRIAELQQLQAPVVVATQPASVAKDRLEELRARLKGA